MEIQTTIVVNNKTLPLVLLSDKTMHENYLLLTRYQNPHEPIKKWVEDDEKYHGSFHYDIQWLWPVVERLEKEGIEVTIGYKQITIQIKEDRNTQKTFSNVVRFPEEKVMQLYLTCVEAIKFLNASVF